MKHLLATLTLLLCIVAPAHAINLDLETFITESVSNHPLINKSESEYLSAVKHNMANTAIKDWNMFANATRVYGASLFGVYEEDSQYTSVEAGVSKIFTQTGSRLGVALTRESTVDQPGFGGFDIPDNYVYAYEISLTQPLLKNALGVLDRHPLILKDYNDKLASIVYKENLESFVAARVAQYIEWQGIYNDLNILQAQAEKLRKQVSLISKQLSRGAAEQLDLVLAKQSLVSKENAVLAQRSRFENETRRIRNTMNGRVVLDTEELIPSSLEISAPSFSEATARSYIRETSLISKLVQTNEAISEQFLRYYSAQTAPQLDVFASKSFESSQTQDSEARKQLGENDPVTIGFVFTKPFENTAAKSQKESAEYALESTKESSRVALLNAEEALLNTFAELHYLIRQINKMKELLTLSKEAEALELKKYNQGRSNSLQFVLSAQERTLTTEIQVESLIRAKWHVINQLNSLLDIYVESYQLGALYE